MGVSNNIFCFYNWWINRDPQMSFIKNVATVIMALNISLHAEDVKQSLQIMDNEVNINYHEGEKINKTCEFVAKTNQEK